MRLIYILLLFVSATLVADVVTGSFTYSGKVYKGKNLLVNDSLKVVYHYSNKLVTSKDIHFIYTDSTGGYKIQINWITPCPSSRFTNCKGISRDSCFHFNSLKWNPDTIGFVYGKKEIKFANHYWNISKENKKDQIFNEDLNF